MSYQICFGLALMLLVFSACDDPFEHSKCRNVPVAKHASPDNAFQAVVREGFCKPDTDKIRLTQVAIERSESSAGVVLEVAGKQEVKITWIDARHVMIECPGLKPDRILDKQDGWQGVQVSYKF